MAAGKLFIVSAPSGAGKTSLLKKALTRLDGFSVAVSHTTRPPRGDEAHSRDYHFIRAEEFERMLEGGEFLEHARVFGHYYGTSRGEVEDRRARGGNVVLEIDCQGAEQVRGKIPEAFSIFILPPSMEALKKRLKARDQDSPETIEHRLDVAHREVRRHHEFDAVIVNDDFDFACEALKRLLAGQVPDPAERERERGQVRQTLRVLLADEGGGV